MISSDPPRQARITRRANPLSRVGHAWQRPARAATCLWLSGRAHVDAGGVQLALVVGATDADDSLPVLQVVYRGSFVVFGDLGLVVIDHLRLCIVRLAAHQDGLG